MPKPAEGSAGFGRQYVSWCLLLLCTWGKNDAEIAEFVYHWQFDISGCDRWTKVGKSTVRLQQDIRLFQANGFCIVSLEMNNFIEITHSVEDIEEALSHKFHHVIF